MNELSHRCGKEVAKVTESSDNKRQRIEDSKLTVESKFAISKVAARKLVEANAELAAAEEYRSLKGNSKSAAKHAMAASSYNECLKDFISFFMIYERHVNSTLSLYDELIAVSDSKETKKVRAEAERFETSQNYLKDSLWDTVGAISGVSEAYDAALKAYAEENPEEAELGYGEALEETAEPTLDDISAYDEPPADVPARDEAPQRESGNQSNAPKNSGAPQGVPPYMPYGAYVPYYSSQNVAIAPASIDISPVIEDAVNTAMKKFKLILDRQAEELSEAASSAIITTDKIVKSESEIAEAEAAIASKLAELMAGLKKLTDDLSVVAESCEKIIETEKDVAERQRRVNDMQRTLVREMQGVQANQKVILGEQTALIEEQAALLELQSANAENHKLILAAEGEVADMQKSLLQAQSAIGESVRDVVNSHKSIVSAEQAIISANAKNIEHQRELAEKQGELVALQKSLMAEHKSTARKAQVQSKKDN